jgi:hypothetical protein
VSGKALSVRLQAYCQGQARRTRVSLGSPHHVKRGLIKTMNLREHDGNRDAEKNGTR